MDISLPRMLPDMCLLWYTWIYVLHYNCTVRYGINDMIARDVIPGYYVSKTHVKAGSNLFLLVWIWHKTRKLSHIRNVITQRDAYMEVSILYRTYTQPWDIRILFCVFCVRWARIHVLPRKGYTLFPIWYIRDVLTPMHVLNANHQDV